MSDIKDYEPLWDSWYVDDQLGEGSFGKVYKVHKQEKEGFGKIYYAAVKMLSIPYNEAQIVQARQEIPEITLPTYFRGFVMDIVQEIDLMREFRGKTNIVSIEDHQVIKKDDLHWDILIRMELLQTLASYMMNHPLKTNDIIKLGIDISRALELCSKKNVIHRDIKPDNIFVSEDGDFKLGDFGVARHIEERITAAMSLKGTRTYMAPEVYNNQPYGPNVDLYSLGIVMYRYLNENRLPFMPPFAEIADGHEREDAILRRMKGDEPVPDIPNIPKELNAFVLKACAFKPEDRFRDAEEFRTELEKIAGVQPQTPVQTSVQEAPRASATRRPKQLRKEDDEGTTGRGLKVKREETIAEPVVVKPEVPEKIMNILSMTGAVCSGILTLLCLFSGRMSDIFFSMPLYAMLVALCILTFRHSALNLVAIVWLVCYLAFTALMNPSGFDYSLLAMTLGILSVEALRSKNPKYRRVLSISLVLCGAVMFILTFRTLGASSSRNFRALVSASFGIPVMLLLSAGMLMFHTKIIPNAAALQMWPVVSYLLMVVFALGGNFSQTMFNLANSCFVGFSPERFSWWMYGRILGLIVQVAAAECVVLTAAARMIPADFLAVLANKKSSIAVFGIGIIAVVIGIYVIAII